MKLDQFLKWKNLVSSGGEAKIFIKSGSVKVNGVIGGTNCKIFCWSISFTLSIAAVY